MLPLLIVYIGLPLQMTLNRGDLATSIVQNTPDLAPEHVDFAVAAALFYTWTLHAINIVLVVWFVLRARRGRRWARIALTIYLIAATGFSFISMAAGLQYGLWAVPGDVIHVAMLGLLWLPPSMRRFFST